MATPEPLNVPPAVNFSTHPAIANHPYNMDTYNPLSNQYGAPMTSLWSGVPDLDIPITAGVDYGGTSSCVYAANIIRSMRPDAGMELEADLGCGPAGTDCEVDNVAVFDMMDKYSAHRMSL